MVALNAKVTSYRRKNILFCFGFSETVKAAIKMVYFAGEKYSLQLILQGNWQIIKSLLRYKPASFSNHGLFFLALHLSLRSHVGLHYYEPGVGVL